MKTMFKKTLVAAALAGIGFNAFAANVAVTTTNISKQGAAALAGATIAAGDVPTITFSPKEAYSVGDIVTFTFSGGVLDSAPLTITSDGVNDLTLGRIGLTANTVTYRVSEVTAGGAVHGDIVFDGVANTKFGFKRAEVVAAGTVTVTAKSALVGSGDTFDTATGTDKLTRDVFKVVDQYALEMDTSIEATIDIDGGGTPANVRKVFLGGATQTLIADIVTKSTVANFTPTSTTYTVKGDFSWAFEGDDEEAAVGADNANLCDVGVAGTDFAMTATQFTVTCTGAPAQITFTFDETAYALAIADRPELSPTTFTIEAVVDYPVSNEMALAAVDAGEWDINGSVINVPYMVYGDVNNNGVNFGQIINVNNFSNRDAEVYVDVWDAEGNVLVSGENLQDADGKPLAKKNAVTRLAGPIKALIPNYKGFASIRVLTATSEDDVIIYSAYTSNGERVIVNNDSPVTSK